LLFKQTKKTKKQANKGVGSSSSSSERSASIKYKVEKEESLCCGLVGWLVGLDMFLLKVKNKTKQNKPKKCFGGDLQNTQLCFEQDFPIESRMIIQIKAVYSLTCLV